MTVRRSIGWSARLAAVAAGTVGLALVGVGATPAHAQTAPVDGAKVDCISAPADARVRVGTEPALDPNSLSASEVATMERTFDAAVRQARKAGTLKRGGTIEIPVVMHVITKKDGTTGAVSPEQLQRQIDVLNKGYAGTTSGASTNTTFQFALASTTTTPNNDWYKWSLSDKDDAEAKRALHTGGLETLNVYVTGLQDGLLGYATFPGSVPDFKDGVVILNASLPGGEAAPYDKGDTLTHEVGHWLNLFHTFQGGCSKQNDRVKDTPAQADGDNIFSCKNLNTCKAAGRDPVHNFMSYGTDKCLDRFTPGQARRMQNAWNAIRNPVG